MTRRYGRAPRGQRVVGTVPRNQGTNTTLFAAMDLTGITAAMTLEGAADGASFEVFVDQILAPSLRPGQVVIWDNLSVHKRAAARRLIEARGCQLRFLPPYSPDFSPIELAFSKLKTGFAPGGRTDAGGVRGCDCGRTGDNHRSRCACLVSPLWLHARTPTAMTTALRGYNSR